MSRALATVLIASVLTGCQQAQRPDAPLPIGTVLGLTGENSAYGVNMRRGLDLAVEQVNSTGKLGLHPVRLLVEDSGWDPLRGVSAYRKLHDVDGVRLFSAICGSKVALAVLEAARDDDIVVVDSMSTAPKLTTAGGPRYFRVCASDARAGHNNVDWALSEGARSFLVVYVDDEWGVSYRDALRTVLASSGFVPAEIAVPPRARDLKVEAQKAVRVGADAVFLALYANLAVPFVQQGRAYGLRGRLYGGDNLSSSDFVVAGADAIEGIRLSLPGEEMSEALAAFSRAYRQRFGEEPDVFALKSYDALVVLADAVRAVGPAPAAITVRLLSMPPHQGLSGRIQFDRNGDLVGQSYRRMAYAEGVLRPVGR